MSAATPATPADPSEVQSLVEGIEWYTSRRKAVPLQYAERACDQLRRMHAALSAAPPAQQPGPAAVDALAARPHAWAWKNLRTGKQGVYFEDPEPYGIVGHEDYEWTLLYTAQQPAPAPDGWLPIETAPTTAWYEKKLIIIYCMPGDYRPTSQKPVQFVAYRRYGVFDGTPYWATENSVIDVCVHRPTYWRPLPAPPSQDASKGGASHGE